MQAILFAHHADEAAVLNVILQQAGFHIKKANLHILEKLLNISSFTCYSLILLEELISQKSG